MEQLHAHEVLHMMEGNSYTEASLRAAIVEKFGEHQRFYTCSADNMEVDDATEPKNPAGLPKQRCHPVYPAWRKDTLPRVRHSEDSDG